MSGVNGVRRRLRGVNTTLDLIFVGGIDLIGEGELVRFWIAAENSVDFKALDSECSFIVAGSGGAGGMLSVGGDAF